MYVSENGVLSITKITNAKGEEVLPNKQDSISRQQQQSQIIISNELQQNNSLQRMHAPNSVAGSGNGLYQMQQQQPSKCNK